MIYFICGSTSCNKCCPFQLFSYSDCSFLNSSASGFTSLYPLTSNSSSLCSSAASSFLTVLFAPLLILVAFQLLPWPQTYLPCTSTYPPHTHPPSTPNSPPRAPWPPTSPSHRHTRTSPPLILPPHTP